MRGKNICLATLVTVLVGAGAAWGQYSPVPTPSSPPSPPSSQVSSPQPDGSMGPATSPTGILGDTPEQHEGAPMRLALSDWILGTHPGCCGPTGGDGPVQMELYLQAGLSFPTGGAIFGHTLEPGWEIQGGGRTLFFNPAQEAAWVIDLSLNNIHNQGQHPEFLVGLNHILVPLSTNPANPNSPNFGIVNFVPGKHRVQLANPGHGALMPDQLVVPGLPIANLNRTFANASLGREWYLIGSGAKCHGGCDHDCSEVTWRIGCDGGGRWGSAKLELHSVEAPPNDPVTGRPHILSTRHRTDVIEGAFVGVHSDVEIPCGCCIFQAGVRVEWDYTFMNILQDQNNADFQELNLLFTAGVRF